MFSEFVFPNTPLFNVVNDFITIKFQEKYVGIHKHSARALSGISRKWHLLINGQIVVNIAKYYVLYKMKTVLDKVVKIANFIKAHLLKSRLLSALCNEIGSDHEHFLKHSEMHWLSWGKLF